MADPVDEEFEAWWAEWARKHRKGLATVTSIEKVKAVALLAWAAGRRCPLTESLDTMVSVTEGGAPLVPGAAEKRPFGGGYHTPLVKPHQDSLRIKAEKLAARLGLDIERKPGNKIQATGRGEFIETSFWGQMVEALEHKIQRGEL